MLVYQLPVYVAYVGRSYWRWECQKKKKPLEVFPGDSSFKKIPKSVWSENI